MNSQEQKSDPGNLYWSLVEPVWDEIEIYQGPDEFVRTFAAVPRHAGLLFAAHFSQSEICNGGFAQFFSNSTGVLAPEAIEAFKTIGQDFIAEIIREACSLFGDPFPRDRSLRQGKLEKIGAALLDSLDQRFYGIIDSENGGFAVAADNYAATAKKSMPK
jgi:hypothetical protein